MLLKNNKTSSAIEKLSCKVDSIIAMMKADKIRKATKKEKEN